jgi:membrane-bound serine protease (ClpP class)
VALFAAEVKVTSYGLLTVGGLVAMILGAMMLVDAPIPEMRVPLTTIVPGALVVAAGAFALVRLVVAAQRRRPITGPAGMIGRQGVATAPLDPEGWVLVAGELWRAWSEAVVAAGERVEVLAVDGLRLRVRRAA